MAGISLSGLASGADTDSVVAQLMAIERQSTLRLQLRQKQADARQTALRDVSTRLKNLNTAAADLRSSVVWANKQPVTLSDDKSISARTTSGIGPGSYQVNVVTLARAESHTFTYNDRNNPSTIDIGAKQYTIAANATAQEVVDLVNADTTGTVYATLVNGDINFTAKTSGAASSFTVSGQTLTNDVEKIGLDAEIKVDGGASQFSANNVFANAIPGLEITAKSVATGLTVTVGAPGPDMAAVKSKVKAFVEQYNSTVDFVKSKLNEKRVIDPKTDADALKGVLKGDTALSGLLSQLRIGLTETQAGNPSTLDELSELGVSTGGSVGSGAINLSAVGGKLVFDEAKFDAAVASDPTSVRTMLGGMTGTDGFGQRLEAILNPSVQAGGLIDSRIRSMDDEKKRITDSIAAMEKRLASKEARMKAMFAAMESAMGASQQQGQWLAGQIAGLSNNRR